MINHIIFKATGNCNLRCDYCYYVNAIPSRYKMNFPEDKLEVVFKKIADHNKEIYISWHGGEPLLQKISFYQKAQDLAEKYGVTLQQSLQTNGTLLTEDWAKFFADYHFSIGLSIDGDQDMNDKHRIKNSGNGSVYNKVLESIELLDKHNAKFGALTVINPDYSGEAVFNHLLEIGIRSFDILLPKIQWDTPQKPDFEKIAKYVTSMFDAWFVLDDPSIEIRWFENILAKLSGHYGNLCSMYSKCGNHVTIEPNGEIGLCENYREVGDEYYLTGYNILTDDFSDVEHYYKQHLYPKIKLADKCKNCEWLSVCNGGCPYERFKNGDILHNVYCEVHKRVISHINHFLN